MSAQQDHIWSGPWTSCESCGHKLFPALIEGRSTFWEWRGRREHTPERCRHVRAVP